MATPVAREARLGPRHTPLVVPAPPTGWQRLVWFGPGFVWMVSAAGSGELLFTPRIGALYGYALLWALVTTVMLKWLINREVGRYAVCTGLSIIDGFAQLPGPRNWAVWLIVLPQVVVAVATIAGLGGSAATALVLVVPGSDVRLWMIAAVLTAAGLVLLGRYAYVERGATVTAFALGIAAVVAALSVLRHPADLAAGLVPRMPAGVDLGEVLPWLGFMLSGAAGFIWYSFWLPAKGYGLGSAHRRRGVTTLDAQDVVRLRGWVGQMTLDNSVAVVGTLLITVAFLVLGAELLHPRGLVPAQHRVAEVLGHLLGGVWGPAGFWFMVTAVFIAFWGVVLSDQDGFARMFAAATGLLAPVTRRTRDAETETRWRRLYTAVLLTAAPIGLYVTVGEPVGLLKIAGAVEAAHIPVVTWLTLALNRRLPGGLRPSAPIVLATSGAGLFFAAFAVYYVWTLLGPDG